MGRIALFQQMRAKLGAALLLLYLAWEGLGFFLDSIGRVQMLVEILPSALQFLSHPATRAIVLIGGGVLIIWAYIDSQRESQVKRHPKMTCALYIITGAIIGGLAGLGVFIWRETPPTGPVSSVNTSNQTATQPSETEKPPIKGNEPEVGHVPPKPPRNSKPPTQTIINSPGAVQAGRDINVIASDKRIINSIAIRTYVETDTAPTTVTEPRAALGLVSFIALFSAGKKRIRFESDGRIVDHQLETTRRRLAFVYAPETPSELLGQDVTYLASIDVLLVNYSGIFETKKFDTAKDNTRF